jgi:hypothetical protein
MHPRQEELNDYVDGVLDPGAQQQVAQHVEDCTDCALLVAQLQHIVTAAKTLPLLQPRADVWQRIRLSIPELPVAREEQRAESTGQRVKGKGQREEGIGKREEGRGWLYWGWKPAWALGTAAAIVAAFLAGRGVEQRHQRSAALQHEQQAASAVAERNVSTDSSVRERVLLVAVGDHLERSQMVLVELANAQTHGELDISTERQYADDLLASNRLYRQTAVQLGETNVAGVLDDLERVLVEVARGPSQVSMDQLAEIQQRIEAEGILFKVKIIGSDVRERGTSIPAVRKQPVS